MSARQAFNRAKHDLVYAHERGSSLCAPFVSAFPVGGAAVSVLASSVGQSTICASDTTAARLDELQFDLGEGPCWDALSTRSPALYPRVDESAAGSWPLFARGMHDDSLATGVRSMFAFPLFVGSLDIGAVDLYSTSTASLEQQQVLDAMDLASVAAWQVLRRVLADRPTDDDDDPVANNRREVHQATGMVLAQLGISAADAALLLKAHAFSSGRTVAEVSNDVIEKRLDFAADGNA